MKHTILVCIVLLVAVSEIAAFFPESPPRWPLCTKDAEKGTCPTNWDPVCGTDKVTYKNECELCRANLRRKSQIPVASPGKCWS
ncbi:serine protease inhibitor Kazal-type 1-like isoform X1 [Anguilla anguilla]|uniref:serine protease inhibitor Kazal-type 1-like isoform X1 n=1 Tax=Anguilla anguilla TaxID=7936 RepID=UPI0015AB1594|nr:serine protease inhibitor Kazal-type 1-like isoform X1 [Anguilla anguilla]